MEVGYFAQRALTYQAHGEAMGHVLIYMRRAESLTHSFLFHSHNLHVSGFQPSTTRLIPNLGQRFAHPRLNMLEPVGQEVCAINMIVRISQQHVQR